MDPVICMITDRRRLPNGNEDALVARAASAARAGVDLVQVRERDLDDEDLARLVGRVVAAVRGTRTRVLVNDRMDVALAAGAQGVHLRADSAPASRLRMLAPPGFLIGRSVHSAAEAAAGAAAGGLDYLLFGTVFPSASKPAHAAAGVPALCRVVAEVPRLPVLAVGGVTEDTVRALASSGAVGFAGIGLFADGPADGRTHVVAACRAWRGGRSS